MAPRPAFALAWEDGGPEQDLAPREAGVLTVARESRLTAGRYRVALALIDGEERRVTGEIEVVDSASRRQSGPEGREP